MVRLALPPTRTRGCSSRSRRWVVDVALDPRIKKSRQQEARGASLHDGSINTGSGNTPWRKNDVRVDDEFLIEYKRTDRNSISIKAQDLEQLRTNALLEGRTPLMGLELGGRDWTLIETSEFQRRREPGAGCQLGGGEVRQRPRVDVPPVGPTQQAPASGSQGRLSRARRDRKSTRLNSSHLVISYAVFC